MRKRRAVRLTDYASCAGCAAKMSRGSLAEALEGLPSAADPDLLVGFDTADDAGVYRLSGRAAVVNTLDFFPPMVDDPFTFGQVAAANALSDIYAMGAMPRLAMNIVCFPKELPIDALRMILRGALEKVQEAGALLVGGHSIEDREVKYGLSVTGFAHPGRITTNSAARPGDILVLTKPVGVGIVTGALKAGRISQIDAAPAIESMTTLNRAASEVMVEAGVRACTDVTGFGLMGHALEMARGSGVSIEIDSSGVRLFPGARVLVKRRSLRPRTLTTNMASVMREAVADRVPEDIFMCLFDPQTSGGLLMSVAGDRLDALLAKLRARSVDPMVVGRVMERQNGFRIRVV